MQSDFKKNKTDICNKDDLKETIDENLINQLDEEKYEFILAYEFIFAKIQ